LERGEMNKGAGERKKVDQEKIMPGEGKS